jgi:hypothetical protein
MKIYSNIIPSYCTGIGMCFPFHATCILIIYSHEERGKICYKSFRISQSPVLDITFGLFANLDNVGYDLDIALLFENNELH